LVERLRSVDINCLFVRVGMVGDRPIDVDVVA
jgi:hypothetical protein